MKVLKRFCARSKSVLVAVLILTMAVSGTTAVAASALVISFQPSRAVAKAGDIVSVDLHVEGLKGDLMGFNALVGFDPSLVRLEGVEKPGGGSILDPLLIHFVDLDEKTGRVEISAARQGGPSPKSSGDLFTLKLRVLRQGQSSVDYLEVRMRDGDNRPINVEKSSPLRVSIAAAETAGEEGRSLGVTSAPGDQLLDREESRGSGAESSVAEREGGVSPRDRGLSSPLEGKAGEGRLGADTYKPVSLEVRIGRLTAMVGSTAVELDAEPYIYEGRAFLPVRFVAEGLGANVTWEPRQRKVFISRGDVRLELAPGRRILTIGDREVPMDVSPVIAPPGRVMLPIRFVAEALGASVHWDEREMKVSISFGLN